SSDDDHCDTDVNAEHSKLSQKTQLQDDLIIEADLFKSLGDCDVVEIDCDENAMMKPSVVVESQRDGSQFHIIRDIK
ncbi:hypothetical protein VIGAN_01209700, partial [Vigna angularis var. angularis]